VQIHPLLVDVFSDRYTVGIVADLAGYMVASTHKIQ
jgi:hypothetical protein